ncbi:restriction endonuclease subunit S [Rhodobacteraceae bacterium F11138]|nr:restriction endonuclease subunit S [Rhodobacteraceae bacterium F11138]
MSWPTAQLKEVARVVGGATPKSAIEAYWNGDVHWATPKDLTNLQGKTIGETPRRITNDGLKSCAAELLPPYSVLFSSRAPIGHVAINTVPMATNQGFKSMVPGPKLDSNFLYWWLDAHRAHLQSLGNGATFKEVSKRVVERVEIPVPPLDEQKRIAAILDQADALRRLRQRAIDRLNTLGQAIFYEMFGDVPTNSLGLPAQKLTDALNFKTGKLDSNAAVDGGEYPFFTCAKEVFKINKYAFDCEALLLAGNNASADYDVKYYNGKFNAYQRTYVIEINDTTQLTYQYVRAVLESLLAQLKRFSKGSNTKYITMGILNRMEIPIAPIESQLLFSKRQERVLSKKKLLLDQLERTEALFSSLQYRAFRGEL